MASLYQILCGCGQTHQVSGGDAGSRLPCKCGGRVEVPDLRTLRVSAGEPTASPELVIEALLQDGFVPGDGECVCCEMPTENICHVRVECERSESDSEGWKIIYVLRLLHPLAFLASMFHDRRTEREVEGRNVNYRLPVPMCRECARSLSRSGVPNALRKIDVYGQLLDKYPHASVAHPEY